VHEATLVDDNLLLALRYAYSTNLSFFTLTLFANGVLGIRRDSICIVLHNPISFR
jgi:hypothetical protein